MKHLNILSATAFAAGAAATAEAPKKAGAPKAEDRVAPVFTGVATGIEPPKGGKTGSRSELIERIEALEVGAMIGLKNKTKKQVSSQVSKVNNREENQRQKVDVHGNAVTKNGEPMKDADGKVVGHTQVPDMERVKDYSAFDVTAEYAKTLKGTPLEGSTVVIVRNR